MAVSLSRRRDITKTRREIIVHVCVCVCVCVNADCAVVIFLRLHPRRVDWTEERDVRGGPDARGS